jgi:ribosomal RNA assembly protein
MRFLRIPLDRVGVVIGPEGETRATIERRAGVRLRVDSKTGEVEIDDTNARDPLGPLQVEDVVRALGRGFSPEHAFKLFSDEYYLTLFDIHDYVGKKKKDVQRMVGRVIGAQGKTRRILEDMTGCYISVYGHTVGLIADVEAMGIAKIALDMLLNGSEHASVYRFLENKRRQARMTRMDF